MRCGSGFVRQRGIEAIGRYLLQENKLQANRVWGSIFPNQPDEGASSRLFRPGVRSRASCSSHWPGGGWIAGCSRTGLLTTSGKRRSTRCSPLWSVPSGGFGGSWGRGRSTGVIDLAVNSVRMTLMPTAFSNPERSQGPCESQSSGPRKKREGSVWCPRNFRDGHSSRAAGFVGRF